MLYSQTSVTFLNNGFTPKKDILISNVSLGMSLWLRYNVLLIISVMIRDPRKIHVTSY